MGEKGGGTRARRKVAAWSSVGSYHNHYLTTPSRVEKKVYPPVEPRFGRGRLLLYSIKEQGTNVAQTYIYTRVLDAHSRVVI